MKSNPSLVPDNGDVNNVTSLDYELRGLCGLWASTAPQFISASLIYNTGTVSNRASLIYNISTVNNSASLVYNIGTVNNRASLAYNIGTVNNRPSLVLCIGAIK